MKYYTCKGDIRGNCGKKHYYTHTANKCCLKDDLNCKISNGIMAYSDRIIWMIDTDRNIERIAQIDD